MASIGQQIITARKAKGLTQDALAKALNISRSAVAHWEGDRRLPDGEMLLKLSEVLEYSFEDETAKVCENNMQADGHITAGEAQPGPVDPLPAEPLKRISKRTIIFCAVALALVLCVVVFNLSINHRKTENEVETGEAIYPVEYFQQKTPNEAGKAYLRLSATSGIQEGTGRQYQMYTFDMAELNGIGYTIDTIEVCAYQGKTSRSEIYTAADMMQYNNNPVIAPYGTFSFIGGFPVGTYDSVGIIVRGKDDHAQPLAFKGYISF